MGSLHCLAMCGPLNLLMPQSGIGWSKFLMYRLLYNLGRTCTYVLMGALIGFVGNLLILTELQQYITIAFGFLIIVVVLLAGPKKMLSPSGRAFQVFQNRIKQWFARWVGKPSLFNGWMVGMVNGLLPCGLVYMAILGAVVAGSAVDGMLYMFFFGVGTIPMLLVVAYTGTVMQVNTRGILLKLLPVLVGLLFILRGLNLGIPYVSPQLTPTEKGSTIEQCENP